MFAVEGRNKTGVKREPHFDKRLGGADCDIYELSFKCENLPNTDLLSLSDPFLVIYFMQGQEQIELSRTETVWNNLNPYFVTSIDVAMSVSLDPDLKVEVYDRDAKSDQLNRQDFLGSCKFRIREVVAATDKQLRLKLQQQDVKKENKAWLVVFARKLRYPDDKRVARIKVLISDVKVKKGLRLDSICSFYTISFRHGENPDGNLMSNSSLLSRAGNSAMGRNGSVGSTTSEFEIGRLREQASSLLLSMPKISQTWLPVYRSEVRSLSDNNSSDNSSVPSGALSPSSLSSLVSFDEVELNLQLLCNSNMESHIRLEIWIFKADGNHDLYGYVVTTMAEIQQMIEGKAKREKELDGVFRDEEKIGRMKLLDGGKIESSVYQFGLQFNLYGNSKYKPR